MDVPYRIPGYVAAFASPPLLPDSKSLLSESDIIATSARGSCGVLDPAPAPLRIVSLSASSKGDWMYGVRNRLVLSRSLMFSNFAMQGSTALRVRGGGTDLTLMRPRKRSLAVTGEFEGIAPFSA